MCISCIKDRFNQPGNAALKNLGDLHELEFVLGFYHNDLEHTSLKVQLELLGSSFDSNDKVTLAAVKEYFQLLSPPQRSALSEVCTLLKLLMVVPATNAVSERSASGVRRVKTYLRSTMSQMRFNNLLVLHVHKDKTDNLNLVDCLNEFVSLNDHRFSVFGKILNILCCC